jgi:small-conductance mechanosensitive channel
MTYVSRAHPQAPVSYLLRGATLAAVVYAGACGFLGDPSTAADSTATAPTATAAAGVAPPPSDSAGNTEPAVALAEPPATPPATDVAADQLPEQTAPPLAAPVQATSTEARLEQLLANQEAMARRLDSLTTAVAPADSVRRLSASGEVLGEAGQQVRNFGVGILWSVIVVIVFNLSIHGLVWVLDALAERNASQRLFYKRLVPIVRIVLWIFAAYLIVRVIFQVDYQGLIAAGAAVGVAVGFAAQDLLKNLFGGIILVFDQPFQVGDKITVGGTYGEVVSIGLRSTRMVTPDDNLVSVPNAEVVDHQVANANAGELNCQVVTDLYLPGWADEALAKRIAFEAAASSKYVYLNKPIVVLVAEVIKETLSVLTRIRVKAYVLDPRLEFQFQSDVTERARAGFREAGLLKPEHFLRRLVDQSAVGTEAEHEADDNGER